MREAFRLSEGTTERMKLEIGKRRNVEEHSKPIFDDMGRGKLESCLLYTSRCV